MSDWKELKDDHTLRLTQIYQDKSNSLPLRENAFHALAHRFKEGILKICEIRCKRFGHDINVAEQVTTATFKSYAERGRFEIKPEDEADADYLFVGYLVGIVKIELTNYYRQQQRKINYPYDGTEEIITDIPILEGMDINLEQQILIKAIQSLTPSQRTVYLTYKQHEIDGFNLPKKLLIKLREHLGGVKQTTIRGLKKEALDKIKNFTSAMEVTKEFYNGRI
jgi:hypothetical protein